MKLKEARSLGIKYCEENKCNYTYIAHDNTNEFYLTENNTKHTVFLVSRNGSLNAVHDTQYAMDFHRELQRRRKNRRNDNKRKMIDNCNREFETEMTEPAE